MAQSARESLIELAPVHEELGWLGIPWRWSFVYRPQAPADAGDSAWAYVIPQPGKPLVALPITTDVLDALAGRRLPRYIRDGLAVAPRVGGTHWSAWEILSRQQLDEVIEFAGLRFGALTTQT